MTLRDEIVGEYAAVRAPLEEVLAWAFERTRIRPGFKEFVEFARAEGWRVVVVSSGFNELIEPFLERAGIEVEVLANRVDPRPEGWVVRLALRRCVPGLRPVVQALDRRAARRGRRARLRRRRLLGSMCRRGGRPRLRDQAPRPAPREQADSLRALWDFFDIISSLVPAEPERFRRAQERSQRAEGRRRRRRPDSLALISSRLQVSESLIVCCGPNRFRRLVEGRPCALQGVRRLPRGRSRRGVHRRRRSPVSKRCSSASHTCCSPSECS